MANSTNAQFCCIVSLPLNIGSGHSKSYLLAVDVEVGQLAVCSQGALEVLSLDLVSHVLNVSQGAVVLGGCLGDGLGAVLALGVGSNGLPLSGGGVLLGGLGLSLLGGGIGSGSSLLGGSGGGSSRSRSLGLASGRRGGLGKGHDRLRSDGGGSTAGPRHGLHRDGRRGGLGLLGLSGGSLGGSDRGGRGVGRLLGLGDVLLSNLLRRGLGVSRRLLDLGLRSLCGLGNRGLGIAVVGGDVLGGSANLLQLLLNLVGIDSGASGLLRGLLDLGLLSLCLGRDLGNLLGSGLLFGGRLGFRSGLFLFLVVDISQDVVDDEVAGGLRREDKGLDELLGLSGLDGALTNDLDDDVVERGLGIDVCDADFAVLEVEALNSLLDSLGSVMVSMIGLFERC